MVALHQRGRQVAKHPKKGDLLEHIGPEHIPKSLLRADRTVVGKQRVRWARRPVNPREHLLTMRGPVATHSTASRACGSLPGLFSLAIALGATLPVQAGQPRGRDLNGSLEPH